MQKRAALTPLAAAGQEADDMDVLPGSSKKSAEKKKKKCEQAMRTVRIQVDLKQPTKDSFAELNYDELIRKASHKDKDDPSKQLFDDENNEDEDVARLARSFEEKYGNKKRRSGWEDYVDKGMGYDETDPFIDNDEAYDELIPSSLTTKYGGFYVNAGPLDFKPVPVSELPDDSGDRIGGNASPRAPVVKKRKSATSAPGSAGSNNSGVKKKKKDHQPEQRTVAQMIDQKRLNQNRDRVSPDESFLQPARKSRPVIEDDDDQDAVPGQSDQPGSLNVDEIIECVVRGRPNGAQTQKQYQQPSILTEKPSVIRLASDAPKIEGLAMNSLARMVSVAGRIDGERQSSNNGHPPQPHRSRPTDLSQHSSRPPDAISPSPGFKQHPGLMDQHKSPSASSSLLSRSGFPHNTHTHNKIPYDRPSGSMRMQPQQQSPAEPQTKQSPTSAQIRSSFQSVIKTSVDSKKVSESPTMDSLMEKVISNSLQKFPNCSSPFSLPSPTSQLQAKNFKTPPAAHQQPKNSFSSSFLTDSSMRGRSHLDNMILEHLTSDQKAPSVKAKPESPQPVPPDGTSHAKVVKIKDQYRIPNLPVGPKLHHSSSSTSRPNSLPSLSSGKQSPMPQHQQQHQQQHRGQKTSPPAVAAVSSAASTSSQQKVPQPKVVHANRSSPHVRQSPHAPDSMSQFSPVIQSPLWNPMATYQNLFEASSLLTPGYMRVPGLSAALSRPVIPMSQDRSPSNLPQDQFLNMHTYAAPPGGKSETGS